MASDAHRSVRRLPRPEDVIVALPAPPADLPEATRIRGTVLASSLAALDALGLRDAYYDALPQDHHAAIRGLVPGAWHPIELGIAHYRAIESLGLSPEQARENGRHVADRVQRSYLVTLVKTLGLGITPWTLLARTQSVVDRLLDGASCRVTRLGPKEARVELHGAPIARFAYVRDGWAGMFEGGLELVARKTYARDTSPPGTRALAVYVVDWA